MVHYSNSADLAHAPQRDESLAVLFRFLGVGRLALPLRARDGAKVCVDECQCSGLIELPGDDDYGVVRLVVLAVTGLQVFDGHAVDVTAVAEGGLAVVVPGIGRSQDPLAEYAAR